MPFLQVFIREALRLITNEPIVNDKQRKCIDDILTSTKGNNKFWIRKLLTINKRQLQTPGRIHVIYEI